MWSSLLISKLKNKINPKEKQVIKVLFLPSIKWKNKKEKVNEKDRKEGRKQVSKKNEPLENFPKIISKYFKKSIKKCKLNLIKRQVTGSSRNLGSRMHSGLC